MKEIIFSLMLVFAVFSNATAQLILCQQDTAKTITKGNLKALQNKMYLKEKLAAEQAAKASEIKAIEPKKKKNK